MGTLTAWDSTTGGTIPAMSPTKENPVSLMPSLLTGVATRTKFTTFLPSTLILPTSCRTNPACSLTPPLSPKNRTRENVMNPTLRSTKAREGSFRPTGHRFASFQTQSTLQLIQESQSRQKLFPAASSAVIQGFVVPTTQPRGLLLCLRFLMASTMRSFMLP